MLIETKRLIVRSHVSFRFVLDLMQETRHPQTLFVLGWQWKSDLNDSSKFLWVTFEGYTFSTMWEKTNFISFE